MEDEIKSKSIIKIKDFISNASFLNKRNEICGFIGYDEKTKEYVAKIEINEASNPHDFFAINPINYLNFKNSYSLVAVFHSHVLGDETPSEFDVKMADACGLAFIVFSINSKKFHIYEPSFKDYDVKILNRIKVKLQ